MLRSENTLSEAAEDGCSSRIFLAAVDQFGRPASFLFHHSKMSIVELTSAALARYLGNCSLRPAIMSGSLKNLMSFKLSVSDAVGLISKTFEGENNLLALNTFSGYAVSLASLLKHY